MDYRKCYYFSLILIGLMLIGSSSYILSHVRIIGPIILENDFELSYIYFDDFKKCTLQTHEFDYFYDGLCFYNPEIQYLFIFAFLLIIIYALANLLSRRNRNQVHWV